MRRQGGLWPELTSWVNLEAAFQAAARGKRRRPDVALFLLDLEGNLAGIRRALAGKTYRPGGYRDFTIHDPKQRVISAAPFRDRVVHHALTRVLEPLFEPRFTDRSFASRSGFGTHAALDRAAQACGRRRFVLKCDIRRYFPSIDHAILRQLLRRVIKCPDTLALADLIIDASGHPDDSVEYFPGDTLFTPFERRRGLPLGNQTSQFFANVYLNSLDHLVLRRLQPAEYVRYVDDFLLFADSKQELAHMRRAVAAHLDSLRLRLHEGKSRVYRTADGVTFLGWRITPEGRRLKRENVTRFRRRMKRLVRLWEAGRIEWEEIRMRVSGWIGHASHGDTWRLREQIFEEFTFRPRSGLGEKISGAASPPARIPEDGETEQRQGKRKKN